MNKVTHGVNLSTSSKRNCQLSQNFEVSGVSRDLKLVNKHDAAAILGISPETLKKYRLQEGSTLIEGIHYHVWNTRTIRYNPVMLADWGLNRNNPAAHQRTIEAYLQAQPSNQSKRSRRAS